MNLELNIVPLVVSVAINSLLIGCSLLAGVALSFGLTRAARPRGRYVIAVAAFFVAALLPIILTLQAARGVEHQYQISSMTLSPAILERTARVKSSGGIATEPRVPNSTPSAHSLNSFVHALSESSLAGWLVAFYVIVAVLLIGREAVSHVRLARARRGWREADVKHRGEIDFPVDVPLYVDDCEEPCTVGIMRPAVVIPARLFGEMSPETVRSIARHELSHVRWHDPAVNSLVRVVRAALWFSIPLWLLECIVRAEREAAADRAAASLLLSNNESDSTVTEYAEALLAIAKQSSRTFKRRPYRFITTEINGKSGLEERVRRLLTIKDRTSCPRSLLANLILLAGVATIFILPIASQPAEAGSIGDSQENRADVERESYDTVERDAVNNPLSQPASQGEREQGVSDDFRAAPKPVGARQSVRPANNRPIELTSSPPVQHNLTSGETPAITEFVRAEVHAAPQQTSTSRNPQRIEDLQRQMRELERRARAMAEPLMREGEARLRAEFEPQIRAMERQILGATDREARAEVMRIADELRSRIQEAITQRIRDIEIQVRRALQPELDRLEIQMREAYGLELPGANRNVSR